MSNNTLTALVKAPFRFTKMSVVQERVLNLLPDLINPGSDNNKDLLVKAKTGTGKTIAFLVPAIEARYNRINDIKAGTMPRFPEWEKMLRESSPELFASSSAPTEGDEASSSNASAGLDYSSLSKDQRAKLSRDFSRNTVGTLIISPTRELATQIATEAEKLIGAHQNDNDKAPAPRSRSSRYDDRSRDRDSDRGRSPKCVHLLVGGVSRGEQLRDWQSGRPDIIVGTPGRLLDLIRDDARIRAAVAATQTLIFDEADTLLDMGFRDEIKAIVEHLPQPRKLQYSRNVENRGDYVASSDSDMHRQTFLFSATASKKIQEVAQWAMGDINAFLDCVPPGEDQTHQHVPQTAYIVDDAKDQMELLIRLIQHDQLLHPGLSKTIVFAPTTAVTRMLARVLRQTVSNRQLPANSLDRKGRAPQGRIGMPGLGGSVYELHSKMEQKARFNCSSAFRQDTSGGAILVTSDVSARGVDYPGTTRVIQFGIPGNPENYIHRVGRTGRAQHRGGRADILMQSFEAGFLQGGMNGLPVRTSTLDAVRAEIDEKAKAFDEGGYEALGVDAQLASALQRSERAIKQSRGGVLDKYARQKLGPAPFRHPMSELVSSQAEFAAPSFDQEEVQEAFMSMLGFYTSIEGDDIRSSREQRVQGLQQWIRELTDDPEAGYVSQAFLAKLGAFSAGKQRSSRWGGGGDRFARSDRPDPRGNRYGGGLANGSFGARGRPDGGYRGDGQRGGGGSGFGYGGGDRPPRFGRSFDRNDREGGGGFERRPRSGGFGDRGGSGGFGDRRGGFGDRDGGGFGSRQPRETRTFSHRN